MTDWPTIASLATAGGTLVLAVATFSSVRAARETAKVAQRSLLLGIRPVLIPSREGDPAERVLFGDDQTVEVSGGEAGVKRDRENVYLVIPLRNVGAGLAVLHGWQVRAGRQRGGGAHGDPSEFRLQQRDLYVPAGDVGFWQGALRDPAGGVRADVHRALDERDVLTVDLLYGDHDGEQGAISRFLLRPEGESRWNCSVVRHWSLDAGWSDALGEAPGPAQR